MKIIVLGATGMLGYQVFRTSFNRGLDVYGLLRNKKPLIGRLGEKVNQRLREIGDVKDFNSLTNVLKEVRPTHIINCIGIVKQSNLAENFYESISINSLLPHHLTKIATEIDARLIHISTDCVFDGSKGLYKESDLANATDLYGKTKLLGEADYENAITLRTSIIGHEISSTTHGLVEWFLAQTGQVQGFTHAFFSGLTTLELTKVILDYVIAKAIPGGLYQVAVDRISKFDLISLIAKVYNKQIDILPSSGLVIDRSLDGSKFNQTAGYTPLSWERLIEEMKADFEQI